MVRHGAVSFAIICPRMMNPLETDLAADAIDVSCDLLDRIDEIVLLGHTVRVADNVCSSLGWWRLWR